MTEYICTKCLYVGKPKRKKRGSSTTELFSWLIFPFGLPYVFWRMLTKINACRHCGEEFLTPVDSPIGMRLTGIIEEEIAGVKPINTADNHMSGKQKT